MEQISFEHYNGGGLYHLKCKVCGLVVRVEEDPGYHYPYYYWPTVCMRKTVVTNPDDGAAPSHT